MSHNDTNRPAATDNAWFVINVQTREILVEATTKRKATNQRKKLIGFGNPIKGHEAIRVAFDPAAAFLAEEMRSEIAAARREGRESSPEAKAWDRVNTLAAMRLNPGRA